MGNTCCYQSALNLDQEVDDMSDLLKIEEIFIKPTDASQSGEYYFNGVSYEAKESSGSSFISL
jgi:hypothetical protein